MRLNWDDASGPRAARRVLVAAAHGVWYRVMYLRGTGAFLHVRYGFLGPYERVGSRFDSIAAAQRRAQVEEDERNPPFELRD